MSNTNCKYWYTAFFQQGGRCRKAMLGVCVKHWSRAVNMVKNCLTVTNLTVMVQQYNVTVTISHTICGKMKWSVFVPVQHCLEYRNFKKKKKKVLLNTTLSRVIIINIYYMAAMLISGYPNNMGTIQDCVCDNVQHILRGGGGGEGASRQNI